MKNVIMIGIIVIALGGAVAYFATRGGDESVIPDNPESTTVWKCYETGEEFRLTARELNAWKESDRLRRDPKYGQRQMVFKNPDTGEYTIVRAVYDKVCEEWYCAFDPEGNPVPPPDCEKRRELEAKYGG